jgi:hypothetical protein
MKHARLTQCSFLCFTLILGLSAGAIAADRSGAVDQPTITFMGLDGQVTSGQRCITIDDADPSLARAPEDLMSWQKGRTDQVQATINIPVWIHNIYYTSGRNTVGYVTDQMATDQIQVLNDAFNSFGYNFVLYSVDRYNRRQYASWDLGTAKEHTVKSALAVFPQYVLNIYAILPPGGTLGWAYFPWSYPQDHYLHGVVALSNSLPNGGAVPYDEGDTVTHEVGHWAGLYHTFQGGCGGNGDFVADTPPEATPSFGCPIGKDTCAGGGPDPIHNFMDYSDDACMFEFTPGQNDRIDWAMSTYRPLMGTVGKAANLASRGLPEEQLDADPVALEQIARGKGMNLSVHPNPFNPRTEIRYALPRSGFVSVQVYDVSGRRVLRAFEGNQTAGDHVLPIDGSTLASGVYSVVVRSVDQVSTERLILVK